MRLQARSGTLKGESGDVQKRVCYESSCMRFGAGGLVLVGRAVRLSGTRASKALNPDGAGAETGQSTGWQVLQDACS